MTANGTTSAGSAYARYASAQLPPHTSGMNPQVL